MNERGSGPVELAAGVALIMIPIALLVLAFGPMLQRRSFAQLAAGEAARTYVLNGGDTEVVFGRLSALAGTYSIPLGELEVGMCGAEPEPLSEGGASDCGPLVPGGRVEVTVSVSVPLFTLPFRSSSGAPARVGGTTLTVDHVEPVDAYRSLP